jgi:predicted nucleic acid-binding protein
MSKLYVIDTCALISFFHNVFAGVEGYKGTPSLSKVTATLIAEAIYSESTQLRLSIPSVAFMEIYEKWLYKEEFGRLFFYEVFEPLKQSENVEIRPTDREVLENFLKIGGALRNHELHDRLILATAMSLSAPLITFDKKITDYVRETQIIPGVLS